MDEQQPINKTLMAVGIVLCLLLAGSAVYYFKYYPSGLSQATTTPATEDISNKTAQDAGTPNQPSSPPADAPTSVWQVIRPIDETDHVLGSADAELTIVLYSDINCPFCKQFHQTMEQVMDTYGANNTVRWVYRHFPIPSLHPTSEKEAEATECVAELGGNTKFWTYINKLVAEPTIDASNTSPEKESARLALLTKYAGDVGVDKTKFEQCLDSGKYADKISQSTNEAVMLGAQGTPFSIVVDKDGKIAPIPGALTFDQMKQAIDSILNPPASQ